MHFLKKIPATQKSSKKKYFVALALTAILSGVSTYFYINDKKTFDRAVTKISNFFIEIANYLTPYYAPVKPVSYESAELDPKVMGDINKMHEHQQKEYEKWKASQKGSKKSPVENKSKDQTKKTLKMSSYRVKEGDTDEKIAQYFGITAKDLREANPNIKKEQWSELKPGQKLNVFLIAGGPAGSPYNYSENIPAPRSKKKSNEKAAEQTSSSKKSVSAKSENVSQTYTNKKVSKPKKLSKSEKAKEMKKLKAAKKTNGHKKEAVQAVIDKKNSPEAKTNPKENNKKINETINQSELTPKEKKAVKEMAEKKSDKDLIEAKKTLDKKEDVLTVAIVNNDPQYYLEAPKEGFEITIPPEQSHLAYNFWMLHSRSVNRTQPQYGLEEIGIHYFLVLSTDRLLNQMSFKYNGKIVEGSEVFERLDFLREKHMLYYSGTIMLAYQNHWYKWMARFGKPSSQSPSAPK